MRPFSIISPLLSLQLLSLTTAFSLFPYNEYDTFYTSLVRRGLSTFHIILSHGNYSANGPLVSPSIEWNVNGLLLISRASFVARLTGFQSIFATLEVPDVYHLVDGHVGAVLYHLQGLQTGPFEGIPVSGRRINILGGELMVFDDAALLNSLISVEEIGLAEMQLLGEASTPPTEDGGNLTALLPVNPQTSPQFRRGVRRVLRSIHDNFNAGENSKNAKLVQENVTVNDNWNMSNGPAAFVQLVAKWEEAFPGMVYHDDHVLADGMLGAVEFVLEGTQTGSYTSLNGTVVLPTGKVVRLRGFLFFEFDTKGLIIKVTSVNDETLISTQLWPGFVGQYP